MRSYDVDVIIPIHTDSRPLERTVASVLDHTSAHVRMAVVAHNIDPAIIRRMLGRLAQHPNVMLLHLADGIGSPAGPLNHGIARTSSPYYAVLGSDDELAPHAIDSWLALAREKGSSSVMARVERSLSGPEQLPPTRRRRIRDMDAVKDRLLYRCVPQGLVSRTHHPNLRFSEGLLSRPDHDVVDMIHGSEADPDRLLALLSERWNRTPRTLLTRNLARALHRQWPMRTTLSTSV